ncbi:MAG TPA: hypothetical protein ENK72_02055 [Epsilonproteobacteria bacterium]|nr:hypothetical protein [Campylobacterota bacterium]
MIEFTEVSERIKTILHTELKKNRVYDRDIAAALDLEPQYYAVIKKRKKIPFEAIAAYCRKEEISMNWVLYGQRPKQLRSKML